MMMLILFVIVLHVPVGSFAMGNAVSGLHSIFKSVATSNSLFERPKTGFANQWAGLLPSNEHATRAEMVSHEFANIQFTNDVQAQQYGYQNSAKFMNAMGPEALANTANLIQKATETPTLPHLPPAPSYPSTIAQSTVNSPTPQPVQLDIRSEIAARSPLYARQPQEASVIVKPSLLDDSAHKYGNPKPRTFESSPLISPPTRIVYRWQFFTRDQVFNEIKEIIDKNCTNISELDAKLTQAITLWNMGDLDARAHAFLEQVVKISSLCKEKKFVEARIFCEKLENALRNQNKDDLDGDLRFDLCGEAQYIRNIWSAYTGPEVKKYFKGGESLDCVDLDKLGQSGLLSEGNINYLKTIKMNRLQQKPPAAEIAMAAAVYEKSNIADQVACTPDQPKPNEKPYGGKSPIVYEPEAVSVCDLPKINEKIPQECMPSHKTEAERREELQRQEIQQAHEKEQQEMLEKGCNSSKQNLPALGEKAQEKEVDIDNLELELSSEEGKTKERILEEQLTEENVTQDRVDKICKANKELQELVKIIEELKRTTSDHRYGKIEMRMKLVDEYLKKINDCEKLREILVSNNSDVEAISKNTEIPVAFLEKIKKHLFIEEHLLGEGVKHFDVNPDIIDAWQRLINNVYVQSDLKLLLHEYAESLIMQGDKISWKKAHPLINNLYNWEKNY